MPLYEYQCDACGHRFEVIQKFSDPLIEACPKCGSPVRKLMSSPAIQFKGSGFYITDYVKKDQDGKETRDTKGTKDAKDAKPTGESKEPKKESKSESSTPGSSTTDAGSGSTSSPPSTSAAKKDT